MKKSDKKITAFKGFDKNLQCRKFSFEIGKEFIHNGVVKACKSGFHSCEYPLDVFGYYTPADNRFAVVEASGEISRDSEDSKIASAKLFIKAEIKLPELVQYAVEYIFAGLKNDRKASAHKDEERSLATNTGYQSAATNTGYQSAATNTGYRSAATNTGNYSAATNTGNYSAATVEGDDSVAVSTGAQGRAKANLGSAIMLVYRSDDYKIVHVKAGIAGQDGIKPDTFYILNAQGEFEEVKE